MNTNNDFHLLLRRGEEASVTNEKLRGAVARIADQVIVAFGRPRYRALPRGYTIHHGRHMTWSCLVINSETGKKWEEKYSSSAGTGDFYVPTHVPVELLQRFAKDVVEGFLGEIAEMLQKDNETSEAGLAIMTAVSDAVDK